MYACIYMYIYVCKCYIDSFRQSEKDKTRQDTSHIVEALR